MEFEKYRLPNGLEVILRPDNRLPIVAVNLWYHVGPANESRGPHRLRPPVRAHDVPGLGHVAEDGHFRLLEGAGASLINGTTDFDRTNYFEDLPSNQLELALWLESDRMGFLLDRLDEAKLANQQDVVRNERRQSVENAPYGLVEEELWHQLYPEGHPYYASVIGSHEDIQAAKLEDVRDFFQPLLRAQQRQRSRSWATSTSPRPRRWSRSTSAPFRADRRVPEGRRSHAADRGRAARGGHRPGRAAARAHGLASPPPIFKPGDAEAELAARILGGGKASRLYKRLVYDEKIAQSVSARQQSLELGSVFQIDGTAKPGHTADELETAIDEELARFAAEGPTEEKCARADAIHPARA